MIPGKQYTPDDFMAAAWRRRWLIVVPFVVISIGTVAVSQVLPDRYRAEVVLRIVPQRVPESFVRPTVTVRLDERLQSITQQLLTRTQLEAIINELDLYASVRHTMIMEDVIDMMRRNVRIGPPRGGSDGGAFSLGFESDNPRTAVAVSERLAAILIRENVEDRSVFADQTNQFLQSQMEEARRQLKEHEAKLENFRRANPGRMPQEITSNQQSLTNAQNQLRAVQESINRDRDQQLLLQRMIADTSTATPAPSSEGTGATASDPAKLPAAQQLERAQATLKMLETRLKPTHPDIGMQKRLIRELEQKVAAEALQQPVTPEGSPANPVEAARLSRLSQLQGEVESLTRRIASKQAEEQRLLQAAAVYQSRIEAIPTVESQLTELMRDYTSLQATYQGLLTKSQEARIAANLERRNIGEQFKIIDNARLPERPVSPDRPRIILLGAFAGLALGLALATLLEYRDTSLRTENDVIVTLALPVLAFVPTMITTAERRRQKRLTLLLTCSGALVVVLCIAAIAAWRTGAISLWTR